MHALANDAPLMINIAGAFFDAMAQGYASKTPGRAIPGARGSKTLEFRQGRWEVADTYYTNSYGRWSAGTTTIFYEGEAVWQMHYRGWYDRSAIPFLKEALRVNYEKHVFFGGRGPENYRNADNTLMYRNMSVYSTDFRNFSDFQGIEQVFKVVDDRKGGELLGRHEYRGGLLVLKR